MNISKIKELLKERKITQKDLADGINMSRSNMNYILMEKQDLKIEVLEKIAKFLNVDVKYFFDDSEINQTILGNVCERKLLSCVEDVLHSEVNCLNIKVLKDRILTLQEIIYAQTNIISLYCNKLMF